METTLLEEPINQTSRKVSQLLEFMQDKHNLLIVLQDNPDPDAIASATALRCLCKERNHISSTITYGGIIGRSENRSLLRYLDVTMYPWDWIDLAEFDAIALVDTQPGFGNNVLPADHLPDIVIDHHPEQAVCQEVPFIDIREDYGAAATILWEYLSDANLTPNMLLATAMIYAIRSDTQDLGLGASFADLKADEELYPLADKLILSKILHGRLPRNYFQIISQALQTARMYQDCLIAALGDVPHPDIIGELADLFLREDELEWVICYGRYQGKIWISLRTLIPQNHSDQVMRKIVEDMGSGGGHLTRAGGQIPLYSHSDSEYQERERNIQQRFLSILGREINCEESLIQ